MFETVDVGYIGDVRDVDDRFFTLHMTDYNVTMSSTLVKTKLDTDSLFLNQKHFKLDLEHGKLAHATCSRQFTQYV